MGSFLIFGDFQTFSTEPAPEKNEALAQQVMATAQRYPQCAVDAGGSGVAGACLAALVPGGVTGVAPSTSVPRRRCRSDIRVSGSVRVNHVCTYDFLHDRLADGRCLKVLCVLDEYTRECLAIEVGHSLRCQDVILTLTRLMCLYGKPEYIRSDNGREFTPWP